jgi:ferredoxin/flavodoxin
MPVLPGYGCSNKIVSTHPLKPGPLNRAVVAWYSQTGNTRRHGRLIAKTLEAGGIRVTAAELKRIDIDVLNEHQLIIIGSPVFYYDTPEYVKRWLAGLPAITGMPVASYVTFGGPEGNQFNAACSIIQGLAEKGGVPMSLDTFMNMGSFPPVWSGDEVKKHTWATRHLPDTATYQSVRKFARDTIRRVEQGERGKFGKSVNMRQMITRFNPVYWTKKFVDQHYIITDACISCGNCSDTCPVDAINLVNFSIDRDRCELCFGCLNNCPAQAVYMEYNGQKLIGYLDFMKMHNLKIEPPEELRT